MRIYIIGLILCFTYVPITGQTFRCNGKLLIATNLGSAPTSVNKATFGPFNGLFFSQTNQYSTGSFNALGFNAADNYIYAAKTNSNEIVRLKSDNSIEIIGKVPDLDVLKTTAGDCTPEGYYLCHDQTLDQILVFDVVDNFALRDRFSLFWNPNSGFEGPFTARIDALSIDPTNPTLGYTFLGSYFDTDLEPATAQGLLLTINLNFDDPNIGMVTPVAPISDDEIRKIGSLVFSVNGDLYAYGADSPGPDPIQNTFMSIDKFSGLVFKFPTSLNKGVNSDACSCPYNLSFTNFADPNFALCSDSETTYTLTVTNRSFQSISNATMIDTLMEGMIIADITGNYEGTIADNSGIGTKILRLDDLEIPARSEVSINLKVQIIDLPIDRIANQAILTNLPERFGYDLRSDDPATMGNLGDSTRIFSDPQRLEDFVIHITHPTDCLKPEDGKVIISAPALIPGIEYQVHMKNEAFEELVANVVIDDLNSFELIGLVPGAYTFYKITPKTSECSFAMKDTSIMVLAPDELLTLDVFTNSPICEYDNLDLSASVFPPDGGVFWKGPNGFESKALDIKLDSAKFALSGAYSIVLSYGVCKLADTLDIKVAPEIKASIISQDEYCQRDTMKLLANGVGDLVSFRWYAPDQEENMDSVFTIAPASSDHAGDYQLIIDNGFCQDTTTKNINILPTPSLMLDTILTSNFCDPLILKPIVVDDSSVDYKWSPTEGLSCTNCPNPEIEQPINLRYKLNIENEFSCQDSAETFVLLDQETLLYIPNAFSPNNDQVNDHFQIFPNCGVASINYLRIHNRFGAEVFAKNQIGPFYTKDDFWDGHINGQSAKAGVYPWQMEVLMINGQIKTLKGNVTLLP